MCAHARPLEGGEDGGDVLLAPEAHAGTEDDLGVADVFSVQPREQPVGDEFEVFWSAQPGGDFFEGVQEAGEVGVVVELVDGGEIERRGVVFAAEFDEGGGVNRAFKVDVEFGLG